MASMMGICGLRRSHAPSAEKVAPLRLDGPADEPLGMCLAQGCSGRQGMENISHRTESHDEYTQLLFCWRQFFIFSQ